MLLKDVLPAFVAVAHYIMCSDDKAATDLRDRLDDKLPKHYYLTFYTDVTNLNAILYDWEWVKVPSEEILRLILDALESRFLRISAPVSYFAHPQHPSTIAVLRLRSLRWDGTFTKKTPFQSYRPSNGSLQRYI